MSVKTLLDLTNVHVIKDTHCMRLDTIVKVGYYVLHNITDCCTFSTYLR